MIGTKEIRAAVIYPAVALGSLVASQPVIMCDNQSFCEALNVRLNAFYAARQLTYRVQPRTLRPNVHVIEFKDQAVAHDVRSYLGDSGKLPVITVASDSYDNPTVGEMLADIPPLKDRRGLLDSIRKEAKEIAQA